MAIPKYIIEEIKNSVRLSELLGGYMTLRRAGKEHQALCPFHKEKSPSFTVSDDKGFYHCFGCGAHGDAITFLMKHDHMSYVEAIKQLASQAGIDVPEERPEDIQQQQRVESLHEVIEKACAWFIAQLGSEGGWAAREYIEKRGLKPEILQRFRLGYAPKDRSGLKEFLSRQGISEKQMFDVGLLTKPDDGDSYDKFRSRLMFPIINASGQVIAFGGRLISDDPNSRAPKYLNSPETELFHKRRQFYAAPAPDGGKSQVFSKARSSGRLLVVEGYMDVIACVQAGVEEVVASLGTAFTEEHATLLWRAVDEPVLCLDGDSAGSRAMLRAAELVTPLLTPGKSLRFMLMPKGDDPDTLLKRDGRQAFDALIAQAMPLHEAMFNAYVSDVDMADPIRRAGLEKSLAAVASRVTDATVRQHLQRYFKEAIWRHGRAKSGMGGNNKRQPMKPKQSAAPSDPLDKLNRMVLKLLLAYPDLLHYPPAEELLMRVDSADVQLDEVREAMQSFMQEDGGHSFSDMLQSAGLSARANELLKDKSLIIPIIHPENRAEGEAALRQWSDQLDRMSIEKEYQLLTSSIHNGGATDEALERMMLLQQEIQARKLSAPM